MELFDTHFVWFGQVLAVSGKKTLVISHRCPARTKLTMVDREKARLISREDRAILARFTAAHDISTGQLHTVESRYCHGH